MKRLFLVQTVGLNDDVAPCVYSACLHFVILPACAAWLVSAENYYGIAVRYTSSFYRCVTSVIVD